MYTGFNPPRQSGGHGRFIAVFACCLAVALLVGAMAFSVARGFGFGVFRDEYGSLYMMVDGRAVPQPLSAQGAGALTVVEVPRVTPAVVTDASGRQVLSGSQVYSRVAPSVVGIISHYGVAEAESTGTGIILSEDGIIVTNHHVVNGAVEVLVVFEDGTEYQAKVLGKDYYTDLAALKINAAGLNPAELGSSEALVPGDPAYAIGNPLGLELRNTITDGLISAINRDIVFNESGSDLSMTVIQTSCAVNPGNSGGPLCNQYGQVVGIISSKIMGDSFSSIEGLGFAIPTHIAQPVLDDLINLGYVSGRPAIGIVADATASLDERTAAYYGLPVGVVIADVTPGTDAAAKGIRKGDIVTHVNGSAVKTVNEINAIKKNFKVGDTLTLTIYRSGQVFDLDITLVEAK